MRKISNSDPDDLLNNCTAVSHW